MATTSLATVLARSPLLSYCRDANRPRPTGLVGELQSPGSRRQHDRSDTRDQSYVRLRPLKPWCEIGGRCKRTESGGYRRDHLRTLAGARRSRCEGNSHHGLEERTPAQRASPLRAQKRRVLACPVAKWCATGDSNSDRMRSERIASAVGLVAPGADSKDWCSLVASIHPPPRYQRGALPNELRELVLAG